MCGGMIGNGTTLSLDVDGVIAYVRSLDMPNWEAEAVDFTSLDNVDWMCFKTGGLADPGDFVAEFFADPETALPQMHITQLATIVNTNGTSTRTISGSGFITGISLGNSTPGEPIMGTITFKYDAEGTPPTVVNNTP